MGGERGLAAEQCGAVCTHLKRDSNSPSRRRRWRQCRRGRGRGRGECLCTGSVPWCACHRLLRIRQAEAESEGELKNARHVPVVAFVFRSGERAPPQTDAVMQHLLGEFGRRAMVVALPSDQELINLETLPAPEFMGDGDGGEGDRELVSVDDILDELAEANDSAEEDEDEEKGDSGSSSSSSLEGVVMVVATPKGKGRKKRQIGIGAG